MLATLSGLVLCLILVGFIGSSSIFKNDNQVDVITMVFAPSANVMQTLQAVQTLAALLEVETGLTIYAYVSECYGSAIEAMAAQEADVGWLGAVPYAFASDLYGVEANLTTVRFGQSYYRGQFLVHSDSGINDLGDLADKNFAFVDPLSSSGYLYPALHTSKTQGTSAEDFFDQTFFVGGHPEVIRAVYNGEFEGTPIHGGVCYDEARESVVAEIPDVYTKTKVIAYTENIPNEAVSVRSGLDESTVQQVVDGLLAVAATQEGQAALFDLYALQNVYGIQGLVLAEDSDYDIVRDYVAYYGIEYETCSQSIPVTEETDGSLTFTNDEGRDTTLEVPSGAVEQPTEISIAQIPLPPNLPPYYNYTGDAFELNAIVSVPAQTILSQNTSEFNTAYTLTVEYDASGLSSEKEAKLRLNYWQDGMWVEETSSVVDTTINSIVATPDHFSIWAVLGRDSFPVFLPFILLNP